MSTKGVRQQKLPLAPLRVPDDIAVQIAQLDMQRVPQTEIARRCGCTRTTVRRVLERVKMARSVTVDTEGERSDAVAFYREIQRLALAGATEANEEGRRPPASLLGVALQAQARVDALLGTELTTSTEAGASTAITRLRATMIEAVMEVVPDAGPAIAQRLLEVSDADAA